MGGAFEVKPWLQALVFCSHSFGFSVNACVLQSSPSEWGWLDIPGASQVQKGERTRSTCDVFCSTACCGDGRCGGDEDCGGVGVGVGVADRDGIGRRGGEGFEIGTSPSSGRVVDCWSRKRH